MTMTGKLPERVKEVPMNNASKELVKACKDRSMSPVDRASLVVFQVTEHGMDYIPAIAQLIKDSDEAANVVETIKDLGEEPLSTERYLGPAKLTGVGKLACAISGVQYAWVTTRDSVACMPCDIKDELKVGDMVLIAPKVSRIVGKDGDLASCGVVATVEAIPEDKYGQAVVKIGEALAVAWLHHSLLETPLAIGDRVIYDERHRFVLSRVSTDTKGDELLTEQTKLPIVRRDMVGAPHPVAEQIVNHFRDAFEHPDWLEKLGCRDRKGYLFVGGTGGGKSFHIKLIATEIHDLVEQYTGQRTSRVFMCDASQFWDPYFGSSEQKINNWAKKLEALGSQKITDKDGKEVTVPLLGVIEECEGLLRSRGGDQHASGHLFDRVLGLLLQKLESAESALNVPVVWICSTNRPDLIDAAAMRRIGARKVLFGNLTADAAEKVMLTKTAKLNVDGDRLAEQVVAYLYQSEDRQALANVTFQGGKSRTVHRRDLVTPAILEEAVSHAVDKCLTRSREAGRLQRVAAGDVVEFLGNHFGHLAGMLTPYNIPEYCPEWFAHDHTKVTNVSVVK